MAYLQFVPDLFLEVAEMNRFKEALDDNGFRKALLEDSISFGLVKSAADATFANGKVQRDLDNSLGQKTIKIAALVAIDSNGQFIVQDAVNNIAVPGDGNWYWVKVSHQYTSQEKGTVAIDAVGNLTGTGTEFTKILRGNPNFPTRIKFIGSSSNTLEYDVLSVTDDTHAVIVHPAVTVGGTAAFTSESNLGFEIVGTFTPGVAVDNDNKFPFKYDSCALSLEVEATLNVRPTYTVGQEFFLARVQVNNGNLILQDKRTDYWETKGSYKAIEIDRSANPLIGVESVRYENAFNTGDKNLVDVAWGMRTANWTVDTSQNLVSMQTANGGSYKDTSSFVNGQFNGWRLYTSNGKFRTVVTSVKQGGAINLFLDFLDVDDFSNDGGVTFIAQTILCVPNCEEVQLQFTANPADNVTNVAEVYTFPVNTPVAEALATVYKDPTVLYNVQYRYKSFREYTTWTPITSGSYYTEASYDSNGNILPSDSRVTYAYTSNPTAGFIQLQLSPNSFFTFSNKVFKGDIIGVNTITSFSAGTVFELRVGVAKRYQHVVGNISLTDDLYISLSAAGAVEGNEFRIHFDATALNLGTNRIFIADNYSGGTLTAIKTLTQGDIYQMQNTDGGIVIDCVFDNTGHWICYQNYEIGQPYELIMLDGTASDLFDTVSGMGKVKGLFGYCLCNATRSVNGIVVPNLSDRFVVGAGNLYGLGTTGGEATHLLTQAEMPSHFHHMRGNNNGSTGGQGGIVVANYTGEEAINDVQSDGKRTMDLVGGDQPHNNIPPYYAAYYAKRVF